MKVIQNYLAFRITNSSVNNPAMICENVGCLVITEMIEYYYRISKYNEKRKIG